MKTQKHLLKSLVLTTLALLAVLPMQAQNVGDAIYIYRNDGEFNAFYREEIDSMAYSYYDVDSVRYEEIVTQLIYTEDSLYRIPIAVIDSVSFVQPVTKYQPNVLRINEDWLPYVIKIGDSSITFRDDTPPGMLPVKRQVVVAETFEYPFETGFSGRISQITNYADSIVFEVEEVGLSDIYEHLVAVGFSSSYNELEETAAKPHRIYGENFKDGVKFPLPNVELQLGPMSVSCTPTIVLKYIFCIGEKDKDNYASVVFRHSYKGEAGLDCKYDATYAPEPKWGKGFIPVTTGIPGLYGKIRYGAFLRVSGAVASSIRQPFLVTGNSGFVYYEGAGIKRINSWDTHFDDPEISINIDGSVSFGLALQLYFGVVHEKIVSADVTAYLGPKFSGHFILDSSEHYINNTYYSTIKNSEITLSLAAEVVPGYRYIGQQHQELPISLNLGYEWNHWYFVPEYSNLSWSPDKSGYKGTLKGNVSRNLLIPVTLGWALYDKKDNLYKTMYFPATYRKIENWQQNGIEYALEENLPYGAHYKAYPLVKLMGIEMRADKYMEINADAFVETGAASDITSSEATLAGKAEGLEYGQDVDAGVAYTLNQNSDKWTIVSANRREDGSYTVKVSDLQSDKTYYYRAYAYVDGEYYYGETKSFKTEKELAVSTLAASGVTENSAVVSGQLENYKAERLTAYGIAYGTTSGNMQKMAAGNLSADGVFSISLTGLQDDTKYFYRAYGVQDGKEYVGETKSFTTEKKEQEDPDDPDDPNNPDNPDDPDNPNNPDDFEELLTHLCPDNNHPHMIDLGLPSGTKWACCNVGANKPEEAGGYYYWGETEEKEVYFAYYYKYYQFIFDDEGYLEDILAIPIGKDIAGTGYDVARAKWGGSWQMPTKDQVEELFDMVSSMREEGKNSYGVKTLHGMKGTVFKGANNNGIFFPYAGGYPLENTEGFPLCRYGETGAYWTSTCYDESADSATNEKIAYCYGININCGITVDAKAVGLPVRPVCK